MITKAIYEEGVLKPLGKIELEENEEILEMVDLIAPIFVVALTFMRKYLLMSNDAVHVATMKRTNDPDFERVDWIKVWKP